MIKNKKIALIYRSAAVLIATAGILDLLGAFQGSFNINILYFYTALSNILAIVLFIMLIVKTISGIRKDDIDNASYFPRFSMICSVNVMITFVVFWVLLVPQLAGFLPLWTFSNLAVHAITPLLCLVDYILFAKSGHIKYRDVYYIVIFPISYMIASSVAGLAGHDYGIGLPLTDGAPVRFPYFFYDFDRIGLLALVYIAGIVVFFLIIGHVLYFMDKRIRQKTDAVNQN